MLLINAVREETAIFPLLGLPPSQRTARRFLIRHAELAGVFEDVLQLERDPHAPRLRLHRLKGAHEDKHAVSLTYSYRIVLILRLVENEIVLLDVGAPRPLMRAFCDLRVVSVFASLRRDEPNAATTRRSVSNLRR